MTNPTDHEFEQMLQAKGLNAPRITPDMVQANIASEHYFTAGDALKAIDPEEYKLWVDEDPSGKALGLLTFCVLVLRNGFTVTGESACASPENFDAEIGRKIARQNAVEKIWPKLSNKPTSDEYRMQLKDIPLTVIADFVDDSEAAEGTLASLPK